MESRQGLKAVLRSLKFRLSLLISALAVAASAVICVLSYHDALSRGESYIDEELSQISSVIVSYDMLIPRNWRPPNRAQMLLRAVRAPIKNQDFLTPSLSDLFEAHRDIIIAPLYAPPGETIYMPFGLEDGFYSVMIDNKRVRAMISTNREGTRFVVARPLFIVDEMAARALTYYLWRFALLTLIIIPAVFVSIHLLMRPLSLLAQAVNRRDSYDLSPLEHKKLPSEVEPLIEAINRLFARTTESAERERRFLADAAHELRTPLTALTLMVQNLEQERDLKKKEVHLEKLKTALKRQSALTTDLLTLARSRATQTKLPEQSFALRELLIELIEDYSELAEQKNLDLGLVDDSEIKLVTRRDLLKKILSNLLGNAIKYSPPNSAVDVGFKQHADAITIFVSDRGPGITDSAIAHAFEPFWREGGDTQAVPGSGLGLAIVQACCEQLKARCVLENRVGGGLTAQVELSL